jgi:hypothetical protein
VILSVIAMHQHFFPGATPGGISNWMKICALILTGMKGPSSIDDS